MKNNLKIVFVLWNRKNAEFEYSESSAEPFPRLSISGIWPINNERPFIFFCTRLSPKKYWKPENPIFTDQRKSHNGSKD